MNVVKKIVRRGQTLPADQWHQLPGRDQKRDRVNKSEQPKDNESGQPIRIPAREKLFNFATYTKVASWSKSIAIARR